MAKYLDPKADLTFKKIFGEHPDLVISLLNALLPLDEGKKITDIEYLPTELMPEQPWRKNSIVDVRCKDATGRQFIVEMQMEWTTAFKQCVLFNASKAYVRQLGEGNNYRLLQPVYSLCLVNDIFEPDMPEFYHYYRMVHEEHTDKVIDGLNLVFVELPKFLPQTVAEKKCRCFGSAFLPKLAKRRGKYRKNFWRIQKSSEPLKSLRSLPIAKLRCTPTTSSGTLSVLNRLLWTRQKSVMAWVLKKALRKPSVRTPVA